jgi:hypothetical protein
MLEIKLGRAFSKKGTWKRCGYQTWGCIYRDEKVKGLKARLDGTIFIYKLFTFLI